MAEINLLKNEYQDRAFSGLKSFISLYVALGVLLVELLIYGGLFWYGKSLDQRAVAADKDNANITLSITGLDSERQAAIALQRQLYNTQVLLDKHIFWTEAFREIEKYTYKPAYYTSLDVNELDHKFAISGVVPTYSDLGKLLLGLRQSPSLRDINLLSSTIAEKGTTGYSFNIEVGFDPKILEKNAQK